MRSTILLIALFLCATPDADAFGRRRQAQGCTNGSCATSASYATQTTNVTQVTTTSATVTTATDALAEVNAMRAARGLQPFIKDDGLTQAAKAASDYRAANGIHGHIGGNMSDFAFLPPGCTADAAGCGALEPSWGFQACCTDGAYLYAGAATTAGRDGRLYHHIFVRGGNGQTMTVDTSFQGTAARRGLRRR